MVVILLLVPSSSSASLTTPTFTTSVSTAPAKCFITNSQNHSSEYLPPRPPLPKNYHHANRTFLSSNSNSNQNSDRNYSREYVNHITRINISNDFPQAESNNDQQDAIVKEGENHIFFLLFNIIFNKKTNNSEL
jgi:hypothetical protein